MSSLSDRKKTYTRPAVIDLSIEGITGIGAGTCSKGPDVGIAGCVVGTGATAACGDGWEVTAGCTNGGYPYETGGVCRSDGLTTSSCQTGPTATSGSARCSIGSSAIHSVATKSCLGGAADANMCGYGNANSPGPGSS